MKAIQQTLPEIQVLDVRTYRYPDGAIEFTIQTKGQVSGCLIQFGDGHDEDLWLKSAVPNPTFVAEHKYHPGYYKLRIRVFGKDKDRYTDHFMTCGGG